MAAVCWAGVGCDIGGAEELGVIYSLTPESSKSQGDDFETKKSSRETLHPQQFTLR